jgi:hypothetical protein
VEPPPPISGKARAKEAPIFGLWPTRDLVTAFKVSLRETGRMPSDLPDVFKSRPNANVYPYTKGPDFGNDGIAYGDVIAVSLLSPTSDATAEVAPFVARRTRSGVTPLEPKK